ncbi:MAG: nuclear transport factor 2 family protein [Spirochaetaceae bacterium]|nr:nuclear transport factor 2 family protein [Myxococcales bacterium]MCB9726247.1 nuclear transport factor 2 family protein [Spirochaetaceae bacterium]HPG28923.1 nuclear transport factor 2 family protein [Myxococcota bacterium]
MSDPKSVARAFYDAMNARDVEAILALYTEDARTWVLGEGPFAGWHPVSRAALEGFFGIFPELRFEIRSMISEGDVVAMEVESAGRMNDRPYANRYHNRLLVRDGRVAELKEYFDTARAGG